MASVLRIGSAALLVACVSSALVGLAQSPSQGSHVIVARDDIQWKPLRPGAESPSSLEIPRRKDRRS